MLVVYIQIVFIKEWLLNTMKSGSSKNENDEEMVYELDLPVEHKGEPDTFELENQTSIVKNIHRGVSMRGFVKLGS